MALDEIALAQRYEKSVAGEDFPHEGLAASGVDVSAVQRVPGLSAVFTQTYDEKLEVASFEGHLNACESLRPNLITELSEEFGAQAVVLAIDARRRTNGGWNVFTRGGRHDEGIDAVEWARRGEELGAGEILLTSMDTDGVQTGFDCPLTLAVHDATHIPVIASGGAGKPEDFLEVLNGACADAALAASIFHYGTYTVGDLKQFLAGHNVPIRP